MTPLTLVAVSITLPGSFAFAGQSQPLLNALKTFDQEHDRAKKERKLLEVTQQHPESGPTLLALAEITQHVDTRWMAMRGMRDVHFRGCETFLIRELKSTDPLLRANSASRAEDRLNDPVTHLLHPMCAIADRPRGLRPGGVFSQADDVGLRAVIRLAADVSRGGDGPAEIRRCACLF